MNWLMLALLVLAAARAVHLVADDDFPFGGLRDRWHVSQNLFLSWLESGLSCTFCMSVHAGFWSTWLATGMGWIPDLAGWQGVGLFFVVWFAIAELIILVEGTVFSLMGSDH